MRSRSTRASSSVTSVSTAMARHLLDRVYVENVAQLGGAEELGQQLRVEAEGRGAALGEGRIALVEEGRDIAEDQ